MGMASVACRTLSQLLGFIFADLDFTFLEMNPFTLVDGKPYPLDMRGELDGTASFKNFKKYELFLLLLHFPLNN